MSAHSSAATLQRLRQRMAGLLAVRDLPLEIPGAGRPWLLAMPADPDAPLDHMAAHQLDTQGILPGQRTDAASVARSSAASGSFLPYWALVWPSGVALAEALLAEPDALYGSRALELGCGLGTTAMAALACGAQLQVADCFAETLLFCRYNTLRNVGAEPRTLLVNWRTPAGRQACVKDAPYDLLLAADVLYEQDDLDPLLDLVPRLLAPGGRFWLAEPGRRVSQAFVRAALAHGWRDDTTSYERIWPTEEKVVRVTVHRFELPA